MNYVTEANRINSLINSNNKPEIVDYLNIIECLPRNIGADDLESINYFTDCTKKLRDSLELCLEGVNDWMVDLDDYQLKFLNPIHAKSTQYIRGLEFKECGDESIFTFQLLEKARLSLYYRDLYDNLQILRSSVKNVIDGNARNEYCSDTCQRSLLPESKRKANLEKVLSSLKIKTEGNIFAYTMYRITYTVTFEEISKEVLENYDLSRLDYEIMSSEHDACNLLAMVILSIYKWNFAKKSKTVLGELFEAFGLGKINNYKTFGTLLDLFSLSNIEVSNKYSEGFRELFKLLEL